MMDMFEMEDFSLLVDDWNLGQPFDFNQYDDVKVAGVRDDRDLAVIKSEAQGDLLGSIFESPGSNLSDPLGAEWMESADLLQLLGDVAVNSVGIAVQTATPESALLLPASPTTIPDGEPTLAIKEEQPVVNSCGYEFLQNLLKQSELNMLPDAASAPSQLTPPTSPDAQVAPELDISEDSSFAVADLQEAEFIGSPLSADDVESLLSATSPAPSSPSTIDTSSLYEESTSGSTITCQSSDLYRLVANVTKGQKSRASPYSRPQSTKSKSKGRKQTATIDPCPSELELELMSKKDRKKLQNKNAAIRYRQKKKEESDSIQTELSDLEAVNEGLHEKVAQLQREIQYMKDLIHEVQKARGVKSFSV